MSKILTIALGIAVCLVLLSNTALVIDNSPISAEQDITPGLLLSDFNSTISVIPDRCVYPPTYEIENASSFLIRGNYESLINISEESAVNASRSFIEKAFPDELTSGLRTVAPEEGYWPGAPTLIIDWWPRWAMTLVS
ncbi:MAG: hypothetical protein P1Q69_20275, partial [Candidatus Thorarchaeota archaeon]|nr:hypothetical protein [Candidatus Thorarchaeota archaeon]